MAVTPTEWSVVIVGRWNRAILTPSGIAKRLFQLEEGTPLEVLVAIDAPAPPQVKYDGITVVAGDDRLLVHPETPGYPELEKAKAVASRALASLPETPISAAGVNVNYRCDEPLESLQQITRHTWCDDQLSDRRYVITRRQLTRTLKWDDAQINFSVIEQPDSTFQILFNFHHASSDVKKLADWLHTPIEDITSHVRAVLVDCMKLEPENVSHAGTDSEIGDIAAASK